MSEAHDSFDDLSRMIIRRQRELILEFILLGIAVIAAAAAKLFLLPSGIIPSMISSMVSMFAMITMLVGTGFAINKLVKAPSLPSIRSIAFVYAVNLVTAACTIILCYADIYRALGVIDTASNVLSHDPATCLYFSIVTWTTLGYGDFRPSPAARPFAASEAIIGYIAMALLIALFGRMVTWFTSGTAPERPVRSA